MAATFERLHPLAAANGGTPTQGALAGFGKPLSVSGVQQTINRPQNTKGRCGQFITEMRNGINY